MEKATTHFDSPELREEANDMFEKNYPKFEE